MKGTHYLTVRLLSVILTETNLVVVHSGGVVTQPGSVPVMTVSIIERLTNGESQVRCSCHRLLNILI